MSLRHLTLLLLLSFVGASAQAMDTASGPTSDSEAVILYQDGKAAYEKKDFQKSAQFSRTLRTALSRAYGIFGCSLGARGNLF